MNPTTTKVIDWVDTYWALTGLSNLKRVEVFNRAFFVAADDFTFDFPKNAVFFGYVKVNPAATPTVESQPVVFTLQVEPSEIKSQAVLNSASFQTPVRLGCNQCSGNFTAFAVGQVLFDGVLLYGDRELPREEYAAWAGGGAAVYSVLKSAAVPFTP